MSQRDPGVTVVVCRVLLLVVVGVLVVASYYPLKWDPPRTVHNEVSRTAAGYLRFGDMNRARSTGPPSWLAAARRSGAVAILLEAEPRSVHEAAPMMLLASDFWHTDFAFEQQGTALYVWLRRPRSDAAGDPPYVLAGVLRPGRWNAIGLTVTGTSVRIDVDGRTRLAGDIPRDTPGAWGPGQIALGDEVHGGVPWQGEIRLAEVRTAGYAVNYVSPGALSIPRTYWYAPDHVEPFPPTTWTQWGLALVDLLTFIPLGFLIVWSRRPPVHPVIAAGSAAGFAVAIAAGKFLFNQRHTSVVNVTLQFVGGLIGALVAWYLARAVKGRRLP